MDLREQARRTLPKMVFDYLDGAALSEGTARDNENAIGRYRLVADAPADVSNRDLAVQLFGRASRMPIVIGPTGYAGAMWPDGDAILARTAGKYGIPFVVSNGANASLEHIRERAPDTRLWLQVYIAAQFDQTQRLLDRAEALGFDALEVTVDTAIPGRRVRDIVNGFSMPFRWTPAKVANVLAHPSWAWRALKQGQPRPGLIELKQGPVRPETVSDFMRSQINPALTWDDLARVRDKWKGTLIVKGLTSARHVDRAIGAGFDGIVISNHGGRQLDGAIATIDVLSEFVEAAAGRAAILIDSGFRSGTDVFKAVALGASAVQLGRATLYGLAAAGPAGAERALELLRVELDYAMALTGTSSLTAINPDIIRAR